MLPPKGTKVRIKLGKSDYEAPSGEAVTLDLGHSPYKPPNGLKVSIALGASAYTAPSGFAVSINLTPEESAGESQYVGGDGWGLLSSVFGDAKIWNYEQVVKPLSVGDPSLYGVPGIRLQFRGLQPTGLYASLFGQARTINLNRFISLQGRILSLFGTARIQLGTRYVHPISQAYTAWGVTKVESTIRYVRSGGLLSTAFGNPSLKSTKAYIRLSGLNAFRSGTARISFSLQSAEVKNQNPFSLYGRALVADGVRYVEQKDSPLFTRYGTAWASHSPRYIEPRGIFELFPARHTIGTSRTIFVEGLLATKFGTRIIPESRNVYPQGFEGVFGQTLIENKIQYVRPRGFLTYGSEAGHRFGIGDVWNLRQYIHPSHIDTKFGPFFGEDGKWQIFNRNRYLQAYGFPQTQFGYQRLDNNARLIAPAGIASPLEVELTKTTVTHRIRKFALPSIEAPYISSGHIVHLGARVIATPGNVFSHYGEPGLKNTRRYFNYIGLSIQSLFGQAMISHAVRTLRIQEDYSIHPPVISLPTVFHGQRYIDMRGLDSGRFGNSYVVSKFNKATPRWTHIDRVGEPVIKNKTPQIRMWGLLDDYYGKPVIDFYQRKLGPNGLNSQLFGNSRISDRKQVINLDGFGLASQQINRLHKIEKLQTDDYLPRLIEPSGFSTQNFDGKPVHQVHGNVLRPDSDRPMSLFGDTTITANTIRVEPGYWEILIGKPTVGLKDRVVRMGASRDFMMVGRPRLSPHTIYAVVEAPDQAKANHPAGHLHYVDGWENGRSKPPGITCGTPTITHKQRFIRMQGPTFTQFSGLHKIINAQEFIRPKGIQSLRMGVISPLGTQEIKFRLQPLHTFYGQPSIKSVLKQNNNLRVLGMSSALFGKPSIDNLHRELKPAGIFSQAMGQKVDRDTPYMWKGFRVGPLVPTRFGGDIHTRFGETWISYRVREVLMSGEDFSLVNEYDPMHFKQRMFVWNRKQPELPATQMIKANGFLAQAMGTPNIKPAAHYIRPDGNMDNYRKGAL